MKTELIWVGKTVNKHFDTCIADYVERIGHYMPLSISTIAELKNTKNLSAEQQKEREGELILKLIQPADIVVLLDERGPEYRSTDWCLSSADLTDSRPRSMPEPTSSSAFRV